MSPDDESPGTPPRRRGRTRQSRRRHKRARRSGSSGARSSSSDSFLRSRPSRRRQRSRSSRHDRHSECRSKRTRRSLGPSRNRSASKSCSSTEERRRRSPSRLRGSVMKRRSRHHTSQERGRKRSRRKTVSVDSYDSSCSRDRDKDRHNRYKSSSSQKNNALTASDVLELIKSLPATSQPLNHFSMNTNAVPEFDPANKEQNIESWITKVEECAVLYKWSETQMIHYALPKLVGVAKVWYQGLTSLNFSWSQWKEKLLKTFPTVQNYAQLLHEMLDRKAKHNESLETYFYHKINLLNRCDITGKRAVDCIIYGLEDRGMRLGAQAANYSQPEDLLTYLKSIKIEDSKDRRLPYIKKRSNNFSESNRPSAIKCFNCNEIGHPSFKCTKPLLTCGVCKKLGHQSINCRRLIRNNSDNNKPNETEKAVMEVKLIGQSDEKFVLPIHVNGILKKCYVDFGSQCTLIRYTDFKDLHLEFEEIDVPTLKGFGNSHIKPLGKSTVTLKVQSVTATVDVLIVPDELLRYAVLLGHTFTEQAGTIVVKTDTQLIFQKQPTLNNDKVIHDKLKLTISVDTTVTSMNAIPIETSTKLNGQIYVNESFRNLGSDRYIILPGIYTVTDGKGCVFAMNLTENPIKLSKGSLLTRSLVFNQIHESVLEVNRLEHVNIDEPLAQNLNVDESLSVSDRNKLESLLQKYKDCFSFNLADLGLTNLSEMHISLSDNTPVVYRPYRLAFSERQKVRDMIKEMLDCGIITESTSSYASPIILVHKKTGDQRLCVDYRALNSKTVKEHYPLPRVEDQIDQLGGYEFFITLDLASGYYQIPIAPTSQDKTAFVTPDGQYQFTRMPFGLANAPSVFQKTVNKMLKDVRNREAFAFMDDIIIPAHSIEQGLERLEKVLILIKEAGLTLKISKCNFFRTSIEYLGFEISKEGVRPGMRKTEAVEKFKCPSNQHEVRQFLGLASFFRRFVRNFAVIASPLTKLLQKNVKWEWGSTQNQAFCSLKSELTKRPILALYDPSAKTEIHTDASKTGIAGILMQRDELGRLRAISYYSRQTTNEEQRYHSFELETLAVVASLNRFRVYVLGIKFIIVTDCSALRTTFSKRDMIPRIGRWWLQLQEYDCQIVYRPGDKMNHVDALSRNAIPISSEPEPVFEILGIETEDWLGTIQNIDDEILKIKRVLEDAETPKIVDISQNYKLKNGKVYRVVDSQLKWVVPKGVRWQLLKRNHDELGHFGVEKTLDKLKSLYWFPKMNKFVKKYVQSCLECSYHKVPPGKKQGMLHPIPKLDQPFHTIHLDHLGPFVKSKSKNSYLLVVIDAYTKYVTLYPVKNTKSKSSIKVLNNYFSLFGVPKRIISDRGTSFTSKVFKEFINNLGIRHVLNSVATPRANGQVERYNRTILASLAVKNHNCKENEWDKHIEEIQLGLNTTINKGTGKTPAEVLFGIRLQSKGDGIVASLLDREERSKTPIEDIRKGVNLKIDEEQQKQKERYDRTRQMARKYKVGDLVRVERDIGSNDGKSKKLLPKLNGPYRVIKVLDNDRYVVEDTPLTRKQNRKYEGVIAIDKLHPWLTFTRDYSFDSEDDSEIEGEKISVSDGDNDHSGNVSCSDDSVGDNDND